MENVDGIFLSNPHFPIYTVFNLWIGNSHDSFYAKCFFGIMPVLATFPFIWSFCHDIKHKNRIHLKRHQYIMHYCSCFLASGTIAAFPLAINFLGALLFVPATKPDSIYDIYYGIFSYDFLSLLFYNAPFLYVIIFILMNFMLYGMIGCLGLSISQATKKTAIPLILPVISLYIIELINRFIFQYIRVEFSPISYLFPANSHKTKLQIVIIELVVLVILTFIIPVYKEVENEK